MPRRPGRLLPLLFSGGSPRGSHELWALASVFSFPDPAIRVRAGRSHAFASDEIRGWLRLGDLTARCSCGIRVIKCPGFPGFMSHNRAPLFRDAKNAENRLSS